MGTLIEKVPELSRRGRAVVRVSVSNWPTSEADVERSLAALRTAADG